MILWHRSRRWIYWFGNRFDNVAPLPRKRLIEGRAAGWQREWLLAARRRHGALGRFGHGWGRQSGPAPGDQRAQGVLSGPGQQQLAIAGAVAELAELLSALGEGSGNQTGVPAQALRLVLDHGQWIGGSSPPGCGAHGQPNRHQQQQGKGHPRGPADHGQGHGAAGPRGLPSCWGPAAHGEGEVIIDQVWQELMAAGAPGLGKPVSGTEQRRERLLEAIKTDQQQLVQGLREEGNRARFAILRERLRNLGLCLIYVLGFDRLGRQWL